MCTIARLLFLIRPKRQKAAFMLSTLKTIIIMACASCRAPSCREHCYRKKVTFINQYFLLFLIFCRLRRRMQPTFRHKCRRRAKAARWTSKFSSTVHTAAPFMLATSEIHTAWHSAMAATSWRWASTCWLSKEQANTAAFLSVAWVVM